MQRNLAAYDPLPDAQLAATIREHLGTATHRPVDEEIFAALFGQWEGAHGQALYLRNLAQFDEDHTRELEPLLSSISVPVLIAWGEEDAWLPVADSERIAERIPGARRVVIPDAGHFCMEDRPDAVAAALRSFLTSAS
jgi:pimeloyl-ACP methyl ester carboxylesterase